MATSSRPSALRLAAPVLVAWDPQLLARLTSELLAGAAAVETLDPTQGFTPDLLVLVAPSWLVNDAELSGLTRAALLVLVRSMKGRFPLTSAAVITCGQPQEAGGGFDLVGPRAVRLSERARGQGVW